MQLYKIKVVKEDKRVFYDFYLVWSYKRVYYERVSPTFKGFSYVAMFSRAIEAKNVQEMKDNYSKEFDKCS